MAEQSSATAQQKSSDQVQKSEARTQAESSHGSSSKSSSSGGSGDLKSQSQTRANFREGSDNDRAHPMQGKSLEYTSGPGREAYPDNYQTDVVNSLPHLKMHFER